MIDFGYGVALHAVHHADAEWMRLCRNDVDTRRWCRQNGLISRDEQDKWIAGLVGDDSRRMFCIQDQLHRIGVCGLTSIDLINRRAEFSCYLDKTMRGNGYSVNALKTLVAHAFLDMGLEQVWGETFHTNRAARKSFKKAGFGEYGVRPRFYYKDGKWLDAVHCAIFREDFLDVYGRGSDSSGASCAGRLNCVPGCALPSDTPAV